MPDPTTFTTRYQTDLGSSTPHCAKAVINREDFGLTYNAALETGGMLLGDTVTITIDLEATLQA